jgi:hypothetical protein
LDDGGPRPDADLGADAPDTVDGTDGPDVDSGPDCEPGTDSDSDGLNDCREAELCTDPRDADTDDDGLSDREEVDLGYDPCDPDMDNDGVEDGREEEVGLDPNDPTTNEEKGPDGQRWVARACDVIEPQPTFQRTDAGGNWSRTLSSRFSNFARVRTGSGGILPSAIFSDTQSDLFGYMLTLPVQSTSIPGAVLDDQIRSALDAFGSVSGGLLAGGSFQTHDLREAARQEWIYTPDADISAAKLRNRLVEWPYAQPLEELREPFAFDEDRFRVRATAVRRQREDGSDRSILMVGLVPDSSTSPDGRGPVRNALQGMTSHTTVAAADTPVETVCKAEIIESQRPNDTYIYLVVDTNGMVQDYRDRVEQFVGELEVLSDRVQTTKFGVTNMALENRGRIAGGSWTEEPSEVLQRLNQTVLACPADGDWACPGQVTGLEAARRGISYYRGLGSETPPEPRAIGPDDQVITVFVADEDDTSSDGVDTYSNFFSGRSALRGFVSQESGVSPRWCGESVDATRFRSVIESGGATANSLCNSSRLNAQRVFEQAVPPAQFTGPDIDDFPIDPSITVTVEEEHLVETEVGDGFSVENNSTLSFTGEYRGKVWGGDVPTDVAWTYKVYDTDSEGQQP